MANIVTVNPKTIKLVGEEFVAVSQTSKMTRQSWLAARSQGLGGSDIGKLIWPNKWGGPLTVYMSKVALDDSDNGNEYTDYGTIMEEVLRNTYLPTKLIDMGLALKDFEILRSPYLYRSNLWVFAQANIDGVVRLDAGLTVNDFHVEAGTYGLELKTAGYRAAKDWANNGIPDSYFAQVQWYMAVLGLPGFIVGVLIDKTFEIRFIQRNEEFIRHIIEVAGKFWNDHVVTEVAPLSTGAENDLYALDLIYQRSKSDDIVYSDSLDLVFEGYTSIKETVKRYNEELKSLEARLKESIGEKFGVKNDKYVATWNRFETERFDSKRFRAEHPELVAEYLKTSSSSRLEVKKIEE